MSILKSITPLCALAIYAALMVGCAHHVAMPSNAELPLSMFVHQYVIGHPIRTSAWTNAFATVCRNDGSVTQVSAQAASYSFKDWPDDDVLYIWSFQVPDSNRTWFGSGWLDAYLDLGTEIIGVQFSNGCVVWHKNRFQSHQGHFLVEDSSRKFEREKADWSLMLGEMKYLALRKELGTQITDGGGEFEFCSLGRIGLKGDVLHLHVIGAKRTNTADVQVDLKTGKVLSVTRHIEPIGVFISPLP